jgi:multiple sugar transport system substrate-binding protein
MVFNFYIPSFAQAGYIAPIDSYYKDSQVFLPSYRKPLKVAHEMVSYKGSIYGAPQVVVSLGILRYRDDLIKRLQTDEAWKTAYRNLAKKMLQKDLSPKPPDQWTWDDFLATAIFFTKKHNPDSPTEFGTVFQGQSQFGVQFAAHFFGILSSFGGKLVEGTKAAVNSPQGLQAIRFLLDLKRKYDVVPPDVHRYEAFEEFSAFQSGKVAMGLDWDWDTLHLAEQKESPLVFEKMKETIPPQGPGGRATYVQEFAWVVNKYSPFQAQQGMARFLMFASSSREGVLEGLKTGIPPGVYYPDLLTTAKGFSQAAIDHYKFYYERFLGGQEVKKVFWPLVPGSQEVFKGISTALGRALAGEISYEQALRTMEQAINSALKQ